MAVALPYLAVAAMGASALGSIAQGQQQAASANYNAQIQANNAKIATQNAGLLSAEGNSNTAIEQQKTRAQVGDIKAAQAANGVDVNTGSAVDVRSSAAELGELNALSIRSNAARAAYGQQTQAASDTAQSQLDKSQASYDSEAGYVKAGTTLLGQATSGYNSGTWDSWVGSNSLNSGALPGGGYTNSFAPVD